MPVFILIMALNLPLFAAEVTTLDVPRPSGIEFLFVTTDEAFQATVEKQYFASQTCRPRININGQIRELYFNKVCRAEITKFLLNNNYKADQLYRTFVKN